MTHQNITSDENMVLFHAPSGRLAYQNVATGEVVHGIVPVRAYPLTDPAGGLSLLSADGHEVLWLHRPDQQLTQQSFAVLQKALKEREFMPRIQAILHISSISTPSVWQVQTDRGVFSLDLKAEDDIRRLGEASLMVTDTHGIQYVIEDTQLLDKLSQKWLERFL